MKYQPPFTITPAITHLLADTAEAIGRLSAQHEQNLNLRRINRIRTIHGSLAIEGNTLSEEQITAILDGKRVLAPPREIQEVHNAVAAYESLPKWQPDNETDLLAGRPRHHHERFVELAIFAIVAWGLWQAKKSSTWHHRPSACRNSCSNCWLG